MDDLRHIVIAWLEPTQVWDGQPFARDLGEQPRLVETVEPRAVTWLIDGTKADAFRAMAHALTVSPTARVYLFDPAHEDPLGAARAKIIVEQAEGNGR